MPLLYPPPPKIHSKYYPPDDQTHDVYINQYSKINTHFEHQANRSLSTNDDQILDRENFSAGSVCTVWHGGSEFEVEGRKTLHSMHIAGLSGSPG